MVRLSLSALLVLQPFVQAAELAPVDVLLTHLIPQDKAALATSGPEKGERLAKLQSDLTLVAEGLEGFANTQDAEPSLKRLRESVDAPESFKDRATALDATYRALAVVDYTWAKRLPDATCAPEASRARLLKSGALSSWIGTLLGPGSAGAADKLDQASGAARIPAREYALLRAKVHKTTEALGSDKAVGAKRAALYCLRAETFEALSSANRAESGLVAASRSAVDEIDGVYVLARKTADGLEVLGAATAIEGALVTDGRLADGDDLVVLRRGGKSLIPVRVERRDASGLALLRAEEPVKGYTFSDVAPAKDDLIEAIGHPERTGAWTRTRGLVTSADAGSFQTDAVIDVGMAGGAAVAEDGRLAGVFVLRPARNGGDSFDWPVAVSAPALKGWLSGEALTVAPIQISEAGSASILTASRPLAESLSPGAGAMDAGYEFTEGNVHARCMANCGDARSSSGSSYGSNGGKELGDALGAAVAPLIEAMIFKGIPALFRGIGSLFKPAPNAGGSASAAQAVPIIEKKPAPPEPAYTATLARIASENPKEALFVLTLKGNLPELQTAGVPVAFTISDGTETKKGEAVTDSAGRATLRVKPSRMAQGFADLKEESARHPELTNASRTTAETICIVTLGGSIALGTLTVSAVALLTPGRARISYACANAASRAATLAATFCVFQFGKEALAQQASPLEAPRDASPPIQRALEINKTESASDGLRHRAERSFGEVDDHARENSESVPGQSDVAQGAPEFPEEPPEDSDEKSKSANAQDNLKRKLEALEDAEKNSVSKKTLPDGRIRYYGPEKVARQPGQTRGASVVTEYNPKTGDVRMWIESYDQAGEVIRVHPKMINGQVVKSPHFPPIGSELAP